MRNGGRPFSLLSASAVQHRYNPRRLGLRPMSATGPRAAEQPGPAKRRSDSWRGPSSADSQLPLPVILRRAYHGTATLQNSRVPMIEIAIENGITK
jgi:hypothetical protein